MSGKQGAGERKERLRGMKKEGKEREKMGKRENGTGVSLFITVSARSRAQLIFVERMKDQKK